MKRRILLVFILTIASSILANAQIDSLYNFNRGWSFTETDSPEYSLSNYQPDGWKIVDLPHDWSIEKPFAKNLEGCTAFLPGGIGWYSKRIPSIDLDRQNCYIIFDGVYNNTDYWLNGILLGSHPYGYAPVCYDLSSLLEPNSGNRISVRVDHSRYADSRWYTGSGIYRNVKLLVTDKLHIPVWGTFVTTPKVSDRAATVNVVTDLKNDYSSLRKGRLHTVIYSPAGKLVAEDSQFFSLDGNSTMQVEQNLKVKNPELWGIDAPVQYTVKSFIESDERVLSGRSTKFGIRTIRFDKDKGFYLNGQNMKIKGVCLHHDAGLVGTAVPADVWKRRLLLLKDMGCNAIRTAHNPASDEFLSLCDELGFLVQDEFYDEWDYPKDKRYNMQDKEIDYITRGHSQHFQQWAETDLKTIMKSARNHPCIFQWSIGNEIEWTYPGNRGATGIFKEEDKDDKMDWTLWRTSTPPHTPEQVREYLDSFPETAFKIGETAAKLAGWTREMDQTRPLIANCILPTTSFESGYTDVLDIVGLSYKEDKYDYFKKTYPDKIMMGTENVPRWYEWKACIERDYISGIFLWTGFDYLGERRVKMWPEKATPEGPFNTAGFPRGSYYQFKSFWSDDPVLEIFSQTARKSIFKVTPDGKVVEKKKGYWELAPRVWQNVNPHWNYTNGESVIVEIYSNCDTIELFHGNVSLGKQSLADQEDRIFKWATTYNPFSLVAKGVYKGKTIIKELKPAGNEYAIELTADRSVARANGTDVIHITAQLIDEYGIPVSYKEDEFKFEINGPHKFLGTDCGNTRFMKSYKSLSCPTENGKCLLMLQTTDTSGEISIVATSKNYNDITGKISVKVTGQ